jgi:hypothetical protein
VFAKVGLDQGLFAPSFIVVFVSTISALNGHSLQVQPSSSAVFRICNYHMRARSQLFKRMWIRIQIESFLIKDKILGFI